MNGGLKSGRLLPNTHILPYMIENGFVCHPSHYKDSGILTAPVVNNSTAVLCRISSGGRALDCRAGGCGFIAWG